MKNRTKDNSSFSLVELSHALLDLLTRGRGLSEISRGLSGALECGERPTRDDYLAVYEGTGESKFDIDLEFSLEALRFFWGAKSRADDALAGIDLALVDDLTKPPLDRWSTKMRGLLTAYVEPIVGTRPWEHSLVPGEADLPRLVELLARGSFPIQEWRTTESELESAMKSLEALGSNSLESPPPKIKPTGQTVGIIREIESGKTNNEVVAKNGCSADVARKVRANLKADRYEI